MSERLMDCRKQLQQRIADATHNIAELEKNLLLIVPFGRLGSHAEDVLLQVTFNQFVALWDRFLTRLRNEGTMP